MLLNRFPNNFVIDAEIIVDKDVPHSGDLTPGD
jgi:hypothetical protein